MYMYVYILYIYVFAVTWMDVETIILSQPEKNII